ncbi:serine/threonine-protein kinase HAL4/sat4 [Physocladia obscura]|uniref:Serine/threonine-protein kinase HAL4/sat4 n=1 Tax=Physocladia obscura TaxID=109957 RepID=A0AAD5T9N9_9FUNG|nr:serine/threonine-protein kinase HAL4/sat4 [Physocladia obscura]
MSNFDVDIWTTNLDKTHGSQSLKRDKGGKEQSRGDKDDGSSSEAGSSAGGSDADARRTNYSKTTKTGAGAGLNLNLNMNLNGNSSSNNNSKTLYRIFFGGNSAQGANTGPKTSEKSGEKEAAVALLARSKRYASDSEASSAVSSTFTSDDDSDFAPAAPPANPQRSSVGSTASASSNNNSNNNNSNNSAAASSVPRLNSQKMLFKKSATAVADSDSESDFDGPAAKPSKDIRRKSSKISIKGLALGARKKSINSPHAHLDDSSDHEPVANSPAVISSMNANQISGASSANASANIFRNILSKRRNNSTAAELPPAPDQLHPASSSSLAHLNHDPSIVPAISRSASESSFSEKYGSSSNKEVGRGASSVVKLCSPVNSDKKFAIKEFNSRKKGEDYKAYVKKLTAEFCISSSLIHENVVRTVDLIQDDYRRWNLVMEYSEGGDLFSKIQLGLLTDPNIVDCFFRQLVNGVAYLHSEGVAHRDLKPENLLLDKTCTILKITDFGVSAVFRLPLETISRKSVGECGSGPYIAPEVFYNREYEPDLVDVWSIGII